jgi:hypothetical protein
MTLQFTTPDEHEARRRLTAEWYDLQPHERRTLIQALTLRDFVALAKTLASQRRYLTADLAYAHLRAIITCSTSAGGRSWRGRLVRTRTMTRPMWRSTLPPRCFSRCPIRASCISC